MLGPRGPAQMTHRAMIAVVDDEPTWLAAVGRALSRDGHHALLLGDPLRAAEQIPREAPAAVILDNSMPDISGVELARRLTTALGDACPPLILVTADLGELDRDARSLFVAAYEKPVSLRQLMNELRRVLRGRKASGTIVQLDGSEAIDEDEPATG